MFNIYKGAPHLELLMYEYPYVGSTGFTSTDP